MSGVRNEAYNIVISATRMSYGKSIKTFSPDPIWVGINEMNEFEKEFEKEWMKRMNLSRNEWQEWIWVGMNDKNEFEYEWMRRMKCEKKCE